MTGGYEIITLDPDSYEPIELGSGGTLQLAALTIPPAPKLPVWAKNGDGDGGMLVRGPRFDVRECSMQIRVRASSMDEAVNAIGTLVGKLEEAQNVEGGMPVLWQPANSTESLRLRMLLAQITDMPVTVADGWFIGAPILTVAFTCKPFLYGTEIIGPTASGTAPMVTVAIPDVPGDVAAEGRLVVTDGSSKPRRFCEWGLEQHYYTPASPAPLILDSSSLTTTGFAGTALAHTGAYGGTTLATTLLSQPIALAGIPAQPHIGIFRVKGRVYAPLTGQYWRLAWQTGDGPVRNNDYAQPIVTGDFSEIDLGVITIPPALSGAQRWTGRIEAYTTTALGDTGELDDLLLFPAEEGYGRFAATYSYQAGAISARDQFIGAAAGTALNGWVAPAGGTWVTSGVATDFTFADYGSASIQYAQRFTTTDAGYRYAILGSSTFTDVEVGATVKIIVSSAGQFESVIVARWTDANNHLRLRLTLNDNFPGFYTLQIEEVVAGVATTRATTSGIHQAVDYSLRLIAYASGRTIGWWLDENGSTIAQISATSSVVATGGTLASGKVGYADKGDFGTVYRGFTNFYAGVPGGEQLVINSARSLEIRSNANLRQSADGASYGEITSRGSRLFVPPAGDSSRTTRIAVRATRNDLTTMNDSSVADADTTQVQLFYTPRYLAVPR